MVTVHLAQRMLEKLKQSNPPKCGWNIFGFDNYCLQEIILNDYMQPFVPKESIMWEIQAIGLAWIWLSLNLECCQIPQKMLFFS